MGSPVVNAFDINLLLGNTALSSELFIATDPDNDPILAYQILDTNASTTSGFFRLSGNALAANLWHTVVAADLANLVFVAATNIQSDAFQVRAFDGNSWSSVAFASVFTVRLNSVPPVGLINDFTVVGNEKIRVADFISAFDSDGYPIERYRFFDRTASVDSGYFELNGVAQQQQNWFVVHAADLGNLYYVAGTFQQTEIIDMRVYDGAQWSVRDYGFATTRHNANRPVVFYAAYTQEAQTNSLITSLFEWTDEDGNTIKSYRFFDRDDDPDSGFLAVNGVRQPAKQWIDVDAADISNVSWFSAEDNRTEEFMVQVFDGRYKSVPVPIQIESFNRPNLPVGGDIVSEGGVTILLELEEVRLADVFGGIGNMSGFQQFQVVDTNSHETSAKLVLNGIQLAEGTVINLSASQFANLIVRGGTFEQRNLDDIIVRANQSVWTPWTHAWFRTEPEYDTDLDSGVSWIENSPLPTNPKQITYSFMQTVPSYDSGDAPGDGFIRFTSAQRTAVRQIFRLMERFANVSFVEVNDSIFTATGLGGLIRFGNMVADDGFHGFSVVPINPQIDEFGGDVWVNAAWQSIVDVTPGTGAWTDLARLIAGAVGMDGAGGNPGLPGPNSGLSFSVAAHLAGGYSPLFAPGGLQPKNYTLYDVPVLQNIYGANETYASGNNLYDFAGYWNNDSLMFDMIWDTGGVDSLNFSTTNTDNILDIRPGSLSSVLGNNRNLVIPFRVVLENVTGGSGNEFIYGNEVENILYGGAGNDFLSSGGSVDYMYGQEGNDIYEWRAGDNSDVLNELGGAGLDELRLGYVPGMTEKSDFDDLRFRRSGSDVIIDLHVDGNTEAELTIVHQMWGRYRIETLNFAGTRVDMTSIDSLLGTNGNPMSFSISNTQSGNGNGFLATPIPI